MLNFRAPKRLCGVLALALLLAGCSTAAQRQAQAIRTNNVSAGQQLQSCLTAVYNSPENALLRPHGPLKITDATLEQETDPNKATDAEIQVILKVHPQMQACKQAYLDQITRTTPTLVPIMAAVMTNSEDNLISLIQKKITWGELTKKDKDAWIETYQPQIIAEARRIDAGLAQENAAELAQRQAAASAMAQFLQNEQIITNMNRPVVTNCTGFGGTVNCVSH